MSDDDHQEKLLAAAADAASAVDDAMVGLDHARLAERDAVRTAYAAGVTAYRLAQVTGRSQTAIGRWVRDLT